MALSNIEQLVIYMDYPINLSNKLDVSDFVSKIITRNELSYNSSPSRSNDMTIHNDEEAFYVPTIEFEINYLDPNVYATLMQLANSKGFCVKYTDQEMQEEVYRSMYMTEQSIDNLIYGMSTYVDGVTSIKIKMVSRYGYPYTKRSDTTHYKAEYKYHYYQLFAHRFYYNIVPDGVDAQESYV